MLNRLPKWPGEFLELLHELGLANTPNTEIARALGVTERTVRRWKKSRAPRVALLSLWWLTNEGQSTWDAEAFNTMQLHREQTRALWRELLDVRKALEYAKAGRLDGAVHQIRHAYDQPANDTQAA